MDLPATLSSTLGLSTEPQQQAAITGLFQVVGVFITGLLAVLSLIVSLGAARRREAKTREAERERDGRLHQTELARQDARRAERIRDVQLALRADIKIVASHLRTVDFDAKRSAGVDLILASEGESPGYTPFVPELTEPMLWKSISTDIPILPRAVIEPVVLFYDQREALRLFVGDLRSEIFKELDARRKAAMFESYVEMQRKLAFYAGSAFDALGASLDGNAQ